MPLYAKIKDNYCVAYFGNCNEYLVQLRALRPFMEQAFPGVKVFIAHKEEVTYIFKNHSQTLTREQLEKNNFAYIREITCDMEGHPVEEFMQESNIPFGPISFEKNEANRCVILTQGVLPTKNLTNKQIQIACQYAQKQGFIPEINGFIDKNTWVVGVENELFYEAALSGNQITLIPTGIGENLFKKMIPHGEILEIAA